MPNTRYINRIVRIRAVENELNEGVRLLIVERSPSGLLGAWYWCVPAL